MRLALLLTVLSAVFGVSSASAFDPVSSPTQSQLGKTLSGFTFAFVNGQENTYLPGWKDNGCNFVSLRFKVYDSSNNVVAFSDYPVDNYDSRGDFFIFPKTYGAQNDYRLLQINRWNEAGYCVKNRHPIQLFALNVNTGKMVELPSRFSFVSGDLVVNASSLTLEYYQIMEETDGTPYLQHLQSLPKPEVSASTDGMFDSITNAWDSFWNPDSVAFQNPATLPVFLEFRGGSKGWTYSGNDGKTYWLRMNADKYFRSAVIESPLVSFVFDGNETLLSSDSGPNGVAAYRNLSGNNLSRLTDRNFGSGTHLPYVTFISDPYVYFADQSAHIYRWDVRCKTPGYDSCRLDVANSMYYCADSSGNVSPGAEVCGLSNPVGLNGSPPVGDPGSSVSGSTGSGSTGSGSSSPGYGTSYSGALQNCAPKLFSGSLVSYSGSSDPTSCAFRMVGTQYACQSSDGQACVQNGDACLQALVNPEGTPVYSSDLTRYECSVQGTQCQWFSKNSCGPTNSCYQDGDYCRVKGELVPVTVVTTSPDGSTQSSECSGLSCVSQAIDRFSDRLFNQQTPGIVNSVAPSDSGAGVSFSGTQSSAAPLPSQSELTTVLSRTCPMFDDSGFVFHGSGSFRLALTPVVGDIPLASYVTRPIDWVLQPLNNVLALLQTFTVPSDGEELCLFGHVYDVNYQGLFRGKTVFASVTSDAGVPDGFDLVPGKKASDYVGKLTAFDYAALFLAGLFFMFVAFVTIRRNALYE